MVNNRCSSCGRPVPKSRNECSSCSSSTSKKKVYSSTMILANHIERRRR